MTEDNGNGTAVALRPGRRAAPIVQRLRGEYDPAQVELIRSTVAKDCATAGEVAMFLELAARYELDPFAKQIWAAKIGGTLTIIVGHSGLIAVCERYPDYRGVVSDVVREHDHYRKSIDAEGRTVVEHEPRDAEDKPCIDSEKRGKILGAFALLYREGRRPTYFFADFQQYKKKNVWESNPDAMITKAAESVAMRRAYSIGGVVGDAEVTPDSDRASLTAPSADPDFGDDPIVARDLLALFDLLEYTPRKRIIKLAGPYGTGLDDAGRLGLRDELRAEAQEKGIDVPIDAEVVEETQIDLDGVTAA